jgi:hypothetical protein
MFLWPILAYSYTFIFNQSTCTGMYEQHPQNLYRGRGTGAVTLQATETLQVRDTMYFTMCPCISPDLDGYRAPKMKQRPRKTKSRSIRIRFCGQIKTIQIKKIESDQIHCPWLQPVEICLGDFFVA